MKHSEVFQDTSRHSEDLYFTDTPPGDVAYFEQPFEQYSLEGRILYNKGREEPWILSVHGARADYTKANAVSFGLQQRGYSLLGMNMSGHSKAGVLAPEQTTLGDNIREVEAFFDYLKSDHKKTVIGYSLGGTPVLKLLENHASEIDKIVLFYPGIYSKNAYDKHFGTEFRDVISEAYSYRNNDTIDLLRRFNGRLLLVKGQYDGLDPQEYGKPAGTSAGEIEVQGKKYYSPIPKDVIDMVYDAIPEDRRQLIEIPDCDHSVILWMRDHPAEAHHLIDRVHQFLHAS
ncbi:MAG TPA: alpha/beta hydrolase [Candidatus Saccharimonadales bacterium]|nr:alpha/beta hydrolase [Candidatus Saccharimonadales bacterium]